MDGSFLHRLKLAIQMLLPLSGDAVMIFVGLGAYLATCLITRHALTWAWALAPGLCLALAVEAWEIWDHYRLVGLARTEREELLAIAIRHSRDILIVNLAPFAVFVTAHVLARFARG